MAVPPSAGSGGAGRRDDLAGLEDALLEEAEHAADLGRGARADLRALQGRDFLAALPAELRAHAAVLGRLLDAAEADPRWRSLELTGSLATGGGDRLSDLHVRLVSDPAIEARPIRAAVELVHGLGKVVDLLELRAAGADPSQGMIAAELADALRLRLVLLSVGSPSRRAADAVLLHGPGGPPERPADGSAEGSAEGGDVELRQAAEATPAQAREWLFRGWWALGDVATDIARGSFLEAVEAMAEVRRAVCRLWAVGEGVRHPAAGLPSLVRDRAARTPKGLEVLMPRPLPGDLRTAALSAADLLHQAANHAGRRLGEVPRTALESAVRRRLGARR